MAFDVSKFLALTALIAATGSACSSSDKDGTTPDEGGSSGAGGKAGSAGSNESGSTSHPGGQGGAAEGGAGGAAAGNAGEGGVTADGGVGGESLGGGGAGGAVEPGECLGSLAAGGAGGAPAVEPSLEGLCMDFFDVLCPGNEGDAPSYTVCEGVKATGSPAVAVALADCIKALSAEDACDPAKVHACFTGLEGKGCANPAAATACATIKALEGCDAVDLANCEKIADLVNPEMNEGFAGCMDPANEGWYDPSFTGTCVQRLDFCAGVRLY